MHDSENNIKKNNDDNHKSSDKILSREERLREELRKNLRKRKAQAQKK